jgi:hypothetical protein
MSCSSCPGSVPGIHVVPGALNDVDGRDEPGHDRVERADHKGGCYLLFSIFVTV